LAGADVPEYAGERVHFVSPAEGQEVVAGDSLAVELAVEDGLSLSVLLVTYPGGMMMLDPPYRTKLWIDPTRIGPMEFSALGKTAAGEIASSPSVTVLIGPGAAELVALTAHFDNQVLYGPGCLESLDIYGSYTDGIERELTGFRTRYSVVEGMDLICVTDDGVVVGRASGKAVVLVSHGDRELRIPVTVLDGECGNNPPHANLPREFAGRVGQELCLDAPGVFDHDSCLGESLDPAQYRWTLHFESEVHEGTGAVLCFTPDRPGTGVVSLKVTDQHGASSQTAATVRVE
jgi:hypothetical protein